MCSVFLTHRDTLNEAHLYCRSIVLRGRKKIRCANLNQYSHTQCKPSHRYVDSESFHVIISINKVSIVSYSSDENDVIFYHARALVSKPTTGNKVNTFFFDTTDKRFSKSQFTGIISVIIRFDVKKPLIEFFEKLELF